LRLIVDSVLDLPDLCVRSLLVEGDVDISGLIIVIFGFSDEIVSFCIDLLLIRGERFCIYLNLWNLMNRQEFMIFKFLFNFLKLKIKFLVLDNKKFRPETTFLNRTIKNDS
jgi:hypothetical protein